MDQNITNPRFARSVIIKALILFALVNLLFALAAPLTALGRISAYNRVFPGRPRLPYGDDPSRAYNLSLFNLEAMFASHEISAGPKPAGEFRVLLIGDSATWGFLLPHNQTLAAYLNEAGLALPDGRQVRAYNLGYPVMSLAKDLLILSYAVHYQPDLIVWPLTLESFPYDKQLFPPLLQHNPEPVQTLIRRFDLNLDSSDPNPTRPVLWSQTILGRRRDLADLIRLQLYGAAWAATGIDQYIPENFIPPMEDLPADESFHDLEPPHLQETDLAFELLRAGISLAGDTPILFVNEPMYISQGENSHLRYNFFYPRWAYDDFRSLLAEQSLKNGWHYLDLWDLLPPGGFTNSAVHRTPKGEALFAKEVSQAILELVADR